MKVNKKFIKLLKSKTILPPPFFIQRRSPVSLEFFLFKTIYLKQLVNLMKQKIKIKNKK
jgi:hypothetical protein